MSNDLVKTKEGDVAEVTNPVFVAFVLDETSSMEIVRDETISAFNEYVETLKRSGLPFLFGQVNFNTNYINVIHDGIPIEKVSKLTRETYSPRACTPLYDAIVQTIYAAEKKESHLKDSNDLHDVLVVIQTDGEENSSREFNLEQVKALISKKQLDGWGFVFLGADQDAWEAAGSMGIAAGAVASYHSDALGTDRVFGAAAGITVNYASAPPSARSSLRSDFYQTDGKGLDLRDAAPASVKKKSTKVKF